MGNNMYVSVGFPMLLIRNAYIFLSVFSKLHFVIVIESHVSCIHFMLDVRDTVYTDII